MKPMQLGKGMATGTEEIIHQIQGILKEDEYKLMVILQVDIKNAFNSISRAHMLAQVCALCPTLLPWFSMIVFD